MARGNKLIGEIYGEKRGQTYCGKLAISNTCKGRGKGEREKRRRLRCATILFYAAGGGEAPKAPITT
jgi:hypothetical protein